MKLKQPVRQNPETKLILQAIEQLLFGGTSASRDESQGGLFPPDYEFSSLSEDRSFLRELINKKMKTNPGMLQAIDIAGRTGDTSILTNILKGGVPEFESKRVEKERDIPKEGLNLFKGKFPQGY